MRILQPLIIGLRSFFRQRLVKIGLVILVLIFLFCVGFLNYLEPTQIGIARNRISGELSLQDTGGLHLTAPWIGVTRVDTRPIRVSVTSAGRGFSAKLVQFDKRYWREFVEVEGWRYYWWANRISFNLGYTEEHRGMKDILRGYAYSPKQYPFIVILAEYDAN